MHMKDLAMDACDLLCLDVPHAEAIRASLPALEPVEAAAASARALGDPTRLTIATALRRGDELCVCDMAWVVGQSQNLVSHHLRQLKIAGMAGW
jgi:predicted transcriptional regulator